MDLSFLENIGFTRTEAKVYLALLELGLGTAGAVLRVTRLYNSIVHTTLNSLVRKGFASYVRKGRVRHYQAADPKFFVQYLERQRQRAVDLLPVFQARQTASDRQSAEVFQGFNGFKRCLYEFIEDAEKGDEYLYWCFDVGQPGIGEEVYEFYKEFEKERASLGIELKGVAPEKFRDKYQGRDLRKVVFVDFPVLGNLSVFRDKIVITAWEDGQVTFLLQSRKLAESYRKLFYSIWNRYR